jgi:hypothetical protein
VGASSIEEKERRDQIAGEDEEEVESGSRRLRGM